MLQIEFYIKIKINIFNMCNKQLINIFQKKLKMHKIPFSNKLIYNFLNWFKQATNFNGLDILCAMGKGMVYNSKENIDTIRCLSTSKLESLNNTLIIQKIETLIYEKGSNKIPQVDSTKWNELGNSIVQDYYQDKSRLEDISTELLNWIDEGLSKIHKILIDINNESSINLNFIKNFVKYTINIQCLCKVVEPILLEIGLDIPSDYMLSKIIEDLEQCYLICKTTAKDYINIIDENNWYDVLVAILINTFFIPRMCCIKNCSCLSEVYGQQLELSKKQTLDIRDNTWHVFGKYGECNAAISHVWGDMLLINKDAIKVILPCINYLGKKFWLDIVQDEFNAISCRNEYSNKEVYVINWLTLLLGNMINIELFDIIMLTSDWGSRGWTAQESGSAKNIYYIHSEGSVKSQIGNGKKPHIDLLAGNFVNSSTYNALSGLMNRCWRYQADIFSIREWWQKEDSKLILPSWLTQSILCSSGKVTNKYIDKYCWVPNVLQPYWVKEHECIIYEIKSGIIAVEGKVYILSGLEKLIENKYGMLTGITAYEGIQWNLTPVKKGGQISSKSNFDSGFKNIWHKTGTSIFMGITNDESEDEWPQNLHKYNIIHQNKILLGGIVNSLL